ncbi:pancreatic lipase-related protein 2-like isoform X2 [Perognathus longimembris pacificus]|uniref:pancreatic lipase-related protein 2-like isoform X2 n=1 Tax=Perognathus longimembris pacificus TaxID=214514 RepID=UPI0020184AEE|nr:pancreatic lipase-related protein 2-like isoform X2 [Perognathus longimembris pacificus]
MLPFWTVGLLLLATVRGKKVCYEHLDCFTVDKLCPELGPNSLKFPWPPSLIRTSFHLYTNENPDNHELITGTDLTTIKTSHFRLDRKTRFIVHGYLDRGGKKWLLDMCKSMFKVEQVNCICVDWHHGSQVPVYPQAVYNTQVVGAEIAFLVKELSGKLGYSLEDVHVIGHSLGAHVAAEAGRRLEGRLGRITGLDPAEPCFKNTPEEVRLDPSDAMFVDVIHTDISFISFSRGFGMRQKVGHLDFFPNGGVTMPGCRKFSFPSITDINQIWEGVDDLVACNHLRSYKYYTSSILNPGGFLGYPCTSYKDFAKNGCFPCPTNGCPRMGHYADQFEGKNDTVYQTFFLNTGELGNFTCWRYKVSVMLSGKKELRGHINIALHGSNGKSRLYEIFKGSLKPNARHMHVIDVDHNVGEIQTVQFLWKNLGVLPTWDKLGASQITVQNGDGTEYNFCSEKTVSTNTFQPLHHC